MKKVIIVLVLMALLIVPIACGSTNQQKSLTTDENGITQEGYGISVGSAPVPSSSGGKGVPAPTVTSTSQYGSYANDSASSAITTTDPMIVRTANMSLVVEDVAHSIDQIADLAKSHDGYVVSSGVWRNNETIYGNISIRVAVGSFDATIGALGGLASKVTSETTSSQDVTEDYVDLDAQLRNLQATETQLLALMVKAEKVEDILAVQQQLTQVRGQIEQIKGRMQYLERTSSSSLITIDLQEAKLAIKFTATTTNIKTGDTIRFNPDVSGGFAPYSFAWDFGDGSTSTDQYPTHAYNSKGSYTVTLKVTDDQGNTAEEIRESYITVLPGWVAGNTAQDAWHGLSSFGRGLVNVLIWVGIFSPVWIIIGAIVFWINWRMKKKAAR
jgi:PKD repeat protein